MSSFSPLEKLALLGVSIFAGVLWFLVKYEEGFGTFEFLDLVDYSCGFVLGVATLNMFFKGK